ncbi:hypothetical protein [Burkholderia gladioli]|uniref:hypothetical protein n=1 Tax=Burkholderia gladioli TaxID=28095 RepID=UPI001360B2AA|nr:hypothetical protein [Burkholderia gladioli]MBW5286816.1 hypothetical protein [Burkholderia gladioli]
MSAGTCLTTRLAWQQVASKPECRGLRSRAFRSSSMTTGPEDIRLDLLGFSPCAVSIYAKAAKTQRAKVVMRRPPPRKRTVRGVQKMMVRYEYANNAR